MKKTTKITITLIVAIILIGVASFLIYWDFFGNSKNDESNNRQKLAEYNGDLQTKEPDVYTKDAEEADEKSDNDNEVQEQNDGTENEDIINSAAEDTKNDPNTTSTSDSKNIDSLKNVFF